MFNAQEIMAGQIYTSLKNDSTADKIKLLAAMGQADLKGDQLEKEPMEVSDVLLHKVSVTSDSGDSVDYIRTVLISPDGKTCAFVSDGIVSSLENVMEVFGDPSWDKPLRLQAVMVKTRKGFRTYNLRVLG